MRTLLTGELATAIDPDSEYYVKFEVQNASGTWINVGAALGSDWIIDVKWGETIDQAVSSATVTLVPEIGGASLSPLMASSPLNVDDDDAYAPLLHIGGLARFYTATMPRGVALDEGKYRLAFDGRINDTPETDSADGQGPIALPLSSLDAWLMDSQVETDGIEYGTTPVGTPLEDVIQNILDANITAPDPAVTLVKSSASTFAVTGYKLGQQQLLQALVALVLDSTGEDVRYRFDASHVSQFTWLNPDRTRASVDATIPIDSYVMSQFGQSLANVRNAGKIPDPETPGGFKTSVNAGSVALYRRRFFQLPASPLLTTGAQAQTIIDAAVNDLSDAPVEASVLCPFLWFAQLYDRYTFTANDRQFDSDQTLCVVGVQHAIQNGQGSTTLSVTGRVVGAYAAWLRRMGAGPSNDSTLMALNNWRWTDSPDGLTRTYEWDRGGAVAEIFVYDTLEDAQPSDNPWPAEGAIPTETLDPGVDTYTALKPPAGKQRYIQIEPRSADFVEGHVNRDIIDPSPPALSVKISAALVSGLADLTVIVDAGVSDWPVTLDVFEDDPSSDPIATTTLNEDATLTKLDLAALGGRTSPTHRAWFARLTNVAGVQAWASTNSPANAPTVKTRTEKDTAGDFEDIYATVASAGGNAVRLFFREADGVAASIWGLVVGAADTTPLYVASETEVGPSHYFYSGTGSPALKLNDIALTRDQVLRRYLMATDQKTGLSSSWVPVTLSLKDVPFLESMSVVWDVATNNLRVRVKGGAKCASVFIEVSSSSTFTSPSTNSHALNAGDDYTATFALSGSDMGKTWYARATPYNAVLLGGLNGEAMTDETRVDQINLGIKAVVVAGSITAADFQVDVTVSDPSATAATMTLSHTQQGCTVARTGGGSDPLTTTGATFRYTVTRSTTADAGSGGVTFNVTATNRSDGNVFVPADAIDQDAAPSLNVTVNASGNAIATAVGNNNTASWRWMASTSSMPADATVQASGTIVNGRVATVTVLTGLTLGQHYYVKFVPYTASGAGGTSGQIVSAEDDYQNKSQGKTVRLGHTFVAPNVSTNFGHGVSSLSPTSKINAAGYVSFIIPLGVTLTGWRIRANRNFGTGSVTATLFRVDTSGGSANLGTLTHSTTGLQTISSSLSETTAGDLYVVLLQVDTSACANANDNEFWYVEYDYTSPSYVVSV